MGMGRTVVSLTCSNVKNRTSGQFLAGKLKRPLTVSTTAGILQQLARSRHTSRSTHFLKCRQRASNHRSPYITDQFRKNFSRKAMGGGGGSLEEEERGSSLEGEGLTKFIKGLKSYTTIQVFKIMTTISEHFSFDFLH